MDDKTWLSTLGETKVAAKLVEHKIQVFQQISGKAPFDLVAYYKEKLYRISVKSSSQMENDSYIVNLKRVRSNKTENKIYNFSKEEQDIVAVYILKLDRICFIDSEIIDVKTAIQLTEKPKRFANRSWIISDYLDPVKILESKAGLMESRAVLKTV